MAVREADNLLSNNRPIHTAPRMSVPVLRQPTFDWIGTDKLQEHAVLKEVKIIFLTNNYNIKKVQGSQ